jgi:hypothetical protein
LNPRKLAGLLAQALIQAANAEKISYDQVEEIAKDDSEYVHPWVSNGGCYFQQGRLEAL